MSTLPPSSNATGGSATQGDMKTFLGAVRTWLSEAFGTDSTPATVLGALGGLAKAGDTLTGLLKFKNGSDIASASTVNLSTATGNTVKITGTTGITEWTMTAGQVMDVIFAGALLLTHHATKNNLPGGANITTAAGDRARLYYDGTTVYVLSYTKADGRSVAQSLLDTAKNSTSGTSVDFTSIPAGVNKVTLMLNGVSTNGTSPPQVQLGSGSFLTSGYSGTNMLLQVAGNAAASNSAAFLIGVNTANWSAGSILHGAIQLTRLTGNTWACHGVLSSTGTYTGTYLVGGAVALSGVLDRLRLGTAGGTEAFDAGSVNLLCEF